MVVSFDGVVDGVGSVVFDFLEIKVYEGYFIVVVEFDGRGSYGCECVLSCV